jgi:hypothetical protein
VTPAETADVAVGVSESARWAERWTARAAGLHSIFEHAVDKKWAVENPVRHATRPKRRRQNDADPDLEYLILEEPRRRPLA